MVNKIIISDELIGITDAQLQDRLKKEFGFNCGPITATTKDLYVKKLQEFINNSATTKSGRSTPTIKSINTPVKPTTPTSTPTSTPKTRRKTLAKPLDTDDVIESEPELPKPTRRSSIGRSPPRAKVTRVTKRTEKQPISNFSDTETEENPATDKPNTSINGQTALEYSRGSRLLKKSFSNRISAVTRSSTLANNSTKDEVITTPTSTLNRSDSSSDEGSKKLGGVGYSTKRSTVISPRTFKLFNRSSSLSNFSDSENEETNNLDEKDKKEATSFTEAITKRLLRHRPKQTNSTSKPTLTTNNNKESSSFLPSKYLNNQVVTQVSPSSDTAQLAADAYTTQSNWISYGILIAGILFFAFIFSIYFYSRYFSPTAVSSVEEAELNALEREFDFSIHDLNIPGCLKNESTGICSINQIRPVLLIIKEMKKIVDKKLVHHYCSSNENFDIDPYEYSVKSLRSQIEISIGKSLVEMVRQTRADKTKPAEPADLFLSLFVNALDLLDNNSKWHMKPVGEDGRFDKIVIDPNYPKTLHTTCQVKLFLIKTFWYFVVLTVLSLAGSAVYIYLNYIKNQALREKELMFELVEKSTELLQSPDEPQSLAVLHIRDMLLDPQQRKQAFYQRVWEKTVQFIENNESRIKSSLENIDGEDYKTWKWVATTKNQPDSTANNVKNNNNRIDYNPLSDDNTLNSTIQSEKMTEKSSRTVNTSTPIKNSNSTISSSQVKNLQNFVALTRFLKVRNMTDPDAVESDDNWKMVIHKEVLRRCMKQSKDGKTHGIQHIHVDDRNINDGLVYIKCDSIDTASNAFKALHGTTFSNDEQRLINVKFLKEERYYNRFPDAVTLNKALKL